jgi:23S rRNA (adenine-N6)-dimethyltransferase
VAVGRQPAREAPGQHFLRSRRLAADLVGAAEIASGDLVVEIGGGTGVLTHELVRTGAGVVVVERDPALAAQLHARFGDLAAVEIVQADAVEYAWPTAPFAVVANLPFTRSGAILSHLLRDPGVPLRRARAIVQWEFAAKHAAVWPATLRSTYWRAWHDVSIARRLDRTAFSPPPSVGSAVLAFDRRARPRLPVEAHETYWLFLRAAFASQAPVRRSLRASLTALQIKRLAPALGFDAGAHAWDLDAEQWAGLFAFACEHRAERR